jgi:large subunit ribosomal protein L21
MIMLSKIKSREGRGNTMYAIMKSGGKQYTVQEGARVRVEKLGVEPGEGVVIGEVLAVNNGERTVVGSPYVSGASVQGKVLCHGKERKVTVFKYKRRKDSKCKRGHRQQYTELLVEKIQVEA